MRYVEERRQWEHPAELEEGKFETDWRANDMPRSLLDTFGRLVEADDRRERDLAAALTRVAELEAALSSADWQLRLQSRDTALRDIAVLRERLGEAERLLRTWHGTHGARLSPALDAHTDSWLARLDASPQAAPPGDGWMPAPACSACYHPEHKKPCDWFVCQGTAICGCTAAPAATPVQGAPADGPTCKRCKGPGPLCQHGMCLASCVVIDPGAGSCRPEAAVSQAAPADGPTCAAWCGTDWGHGQPVLAWTTGFPEVALLFCTEACRDAGHPLRPAPAVPEPSR